MLGTPGNRTLQGTEDNHSNRKPNCLIMVTEVGRTDSA